MDDLLVIILTIVLMAAGSLGQLIKKKKPVASPEQERSRPEIWETLFGDQDFPETSVPGHREITPETEGSVNPDEVVPEYKFENEEGASAILRKDKKMAENELQNYDEPVMEDFSLKKALVYSEILNPKYF